MKAKDDLTYKALQEKLALLEQKVKLQAELPHLYRWKNYTWAREFMESTNKMTLLCAANQISKSSSQIRKAITWATTPDLWPKLWKNTPLQFWYLYPTRDVASIEFEKKWKPEFLPSGEYKTHPQYGWEEEWKHGSLVAIHFKTNVSIYFKAYAQDASHLQSGSCAAIFCDEELNEHLFDELMFRLAATDGYFHMVFTATLAQEFWRQAIEGKGEDERFPDAHKQQVTMYDCLTYEDGTPGAYSEEKINRIKATCRSEAEVQRRVYGRFVAETGLLYETFERKRHYVPKHPIPPTWRVFAGVDIGSGGGTGHPAAIAFVATSPDYRQFRVVDTWRGDRVLTTSSDIMMKYIEMKRALNLHGVEAYYDYAAKDFGTIAMRMGEPFLQADKSHETGEAVLNVLFRHDMMKIFMGHEQDKLVTELLTLRKGSKKQKNDLSDALRYAVSKIPVDWSVIELDAVKKEEKPLSETDLRRQAFSITGRSEEDVLAEFDEWNEAYG